MKRAGYGWPFSFNHSIMESIHKSTGKRFTGKFAETAVKIGLAKSAEMTEEPKAQKKGKAQKKAKK